MNRFVIHVLADYVLLFTFCRCWVTARLTAS